MLCKSDWQQMKRKYLEINHWIIPSIMQENEEDNAKYIPIPSLKHCQILRDTICFHTQQFCYFTKDGIQNPFRDNKSKRKLHI